MKTLQDKYNLIVEGKGDIANFKREAVNAFPHFVNGQNSYDDIVAILKQKNIIKEAITDQNEQDKIIYDADRVNPYELEKGIAYEMKEPTETWKMDGAGKFTISVEDYLKAKKEAIKNIQKNPLYYTRLITGEKMVSPEKRADTMKPLNKKGDNTVDELNKMTVIKENKSLNDIINSVK
jgi:hypothetical protein